jgi:hypothetical protein
VLRARRARMKRIRALQEKRWATVARTFVCPICGGDHSRADHAKATDTLLARVIQAKESGRS